MYYNFGLADWVVFGAMVAISVGIIIINYFVSRRKSAKVDEFLMGSRDVPVIPTAMSLVASFISAITMIGGPAEVYITGTAFLFATVGKFLGVVLTMAFAIPLFFPLQLSSIYEYLELRYESLIVRKAVVIPSILTDIIYIGMCIYGACIVLNTMVGFAVWKGIIAVGILGTLLSLVGGLKGVIWMDCFQAIVMIVAMVAILIAGSNSLGGINRTVGIFSTYQTDFRLGFDHDVITLWGAIIGNAAFWLSICGFRQAALQRFGTARTYKRSYAIVGGGLVVQSIVWVLAAFCGVLVYSFYAGRGCDPVKAGVMENINGLIPDLVQRVLNYPAVNGLFLAAIFSANYSSMTTSQTSIAANLWEDILKGKLGNKSALTQLLIVRGLVALTGVLGIGVAFACNYAGTSLQRLAYAFSSCFIGPVTGVFILSATFPQANSIGALCGGTTSLLLTLWMSVGRLVNVHRHREQPIVANTTCPLDGFNITSSPYSSTTAKLAVTSATGLRDEGLLYQFYATNPIWYTVIGLIACVVIGLIVSLVTSTCCPPTSVDKKLFFNFVRPCIRNTKKKGEYKYSKAPKDECEESV